MHHDTIAQSIVLRCQESIYGLDDEQLAEIGEILLGSDDPDIVALKLQLKESHA